MDPVALSTQLYMHISSKCDFIVPALECIQYLCMFDDYVSIHTYLVASPSVYPSMHACISTHISIRAVLSYMSLIPGVPVVEFVWRKFPITLSEVGRQNRTDAREEELEPHKAAGHHIHLSHIHLSPAQVTSQHTRHICALTCAYSTNSYQSRAQQLTLHSFHKDYVLGINLFVSKKVEWQSKLLNMQYCE